MSGVTQPLYRSCVYPDRGCPACHHRGCSSCSQCSPKCGRILHLWDGDYESSPCTLPAEHDGSHDDGDDVRWDENESGDITWEWREPAKNGGKK